MAGAATQLCCRMHCHGSPGCCWEVGAADVSHGCIEKKQMKWEAQPRPQPFFSAKQGKGRGLINYVFQEACICFDDEENSIPSVVFCHSLLW